MLAFSNEELSKMPDLNNGDWIQCPRCERQHQVSCATEDGQETRVLMFYNCGGLVFLAGVAGKNVMGTFKYGKSKTDD